MINNLDIRINKKNNGFNYRIILIKKEQKKIHRGLRIARIMRFINLI
jgi:hypothetical protein